MASLVKKFGLYALCSTLLVGGVIAVKLYRAQNNDPGNAEPDAAENSNTGFLSKIWNSKKEETPSLPTTPQQAADYYINVLCTENARRNRLIDSNGVPHFMKPENKALLDGIRQAVIDFESTEITKDDAVFLYPEGMSIDQRDLISARIANYIYLHPKVSTGQAMCEVMANLANEKVGQSLLKQGSRRDPIQITATDISTKIIYLKADPDKIYAVLNGKELRLPEILGGHGEIRKLGISRYSICRNYILSNPPVLNIPAAPAP